VNASRSLHMQAVAALSSSPQALTPVGLSVYTPVAKFLLSYTCAALQHLSSEHGLLGNICAPNDLPGISQTSITAETTPSASKIWTIGSVQPSFQLKRTFSSSHRSSPAGFEHMPTIKPSNLPPHIILVRHGDVSSPKFPALQNPAWAPR
jgi:hypothetical protein